MTDASQFPDYPAAIPEKVPAGKVLVHNNVRPARRQGTRGFRFWLTDPDPDRLVLCECGWAPELAAHFQVRAALVRDSARGGRAPSG